MTDWLMMVLMVLALPFLTCAAFAAGLLFFWYMLWVVNLFGRLVEHIVPGFKDQRR